MTAERFIPTEYGYYWARRGNVPEGWDVVRVNGSPGEFSVEFIGHELDASLDDLIAQGWEFLPEKLEPAFWKRPEFRSGPTNN